MKKIGNIVILFILSAIFTTKVDSHLNNSINIPEVASSHKVTATYYNPVKSQCQGNPLITADGSKINLKKLRNKEIRWIAVSRDLLKYYNYGDTVVVLSSNNKLNGRWIVRDCMNKRFKRKIDFLSHEKNFMNKPETVKIIKYKNCGKF